MGKLVSGKDENSIVVRNGDKLVVPSIPYEVSVVGEVQFATSHLFDAKLNMKDYIYRSGGFTAKAIRVGLKQLKLMECLRRGCSCSSN